MTNKKKAKMITTERALTPRTRRKYNTKYILLAIVNGSRDAYEYCGARGVWGQQSAGLIFEPGTSKRHLTWPEVFNSSFKRPFLVWQKEGFVFVEPVVCTGCNQEVELKETVNGKHTSLEMCLTALRSAHGEIVEDTLSRKH